MRRSLARPTRRRGKRQISPTVLIATNGRVTERTCLSALKRLPKQRDIRIKVEFIDEDPLQLLKKLQSPNGDTSFYTELWIVVDEDGKDVAAFLAECKRISTKNQPWYPVVSRPSFEVWLIAHYQAIRNYRNQHDASRHLSELIGSRKDSKTIPHDFPYDAINDAVTRCHPVGQSSSSPYALPPLPGSAMPHLIAALGIIE